MRGRRLGEKRKISAGVMRFAGVMLALACWGSGVARAADSFIDITRRPDAVGVVTEAGTFKLKLRPTLWGSRTTWRGGNCEVKTVGGKEALGVELYAPKAAVKRIQLRWRAKVNPEWKFLGDHWERAYGDLQWAKLDAKRVMPWYFMAYDGRMTNGYGVMTAPAAICSWQVDAGGVTLTADVRCGGRGVELGERRLKVCEVVDRKGKVGESAFAATQAFCRVMCPKPRLTRQPVYGFNDWYCCYGKNSAEFTRKAAKFVVEMSPKGGNRPYVVIDDGWQSKGDSAMGPWDRSNEKFPSMPAIAAEVKAAGARPGIWIRLLQATKATPKAWRLERDPNYLDPTVPEVRKKVAADIARLRGWGFELIKHDFSTNDLAGLWGMQMKGSMTRDGWAFANRGVTTAEVILDHYRTIREAAGDGVVILGCNTINHLTAGLFEVDRVGDDTSGKEWARTLKMGVNALAFRAPQQGTFHAADADCVGLEKPESVPWAKNGQWLDLLARSGTPLFFSIPREFLNAEQTEALKRALAIAAEPQPVGEPLDWMESKTPAKWKLMGEIKEYRW